MTEEDREMTAFSTLESVWQDARLGLRALRKSPGFTAIAVLTLALGIGATTAIFSVVDAVLLRPMPFKDPGRIVEVWPRGAAVTYETLSGWSSVANFLEPFEAYQPTTLTLTGAGDPKMISAGYVSGGLMTFLGVRPEAGRLLLPDDGKPGQDHTAMISYGLWKGLFGEDPAVIGRTITLDNQEYQVVGVTPRLAFPFAADVWLPFSLTEDSLAAHKLHPILITRLIPPISLTQAQLRMNVVTKRLATERPRRQSWDAQLLSMDAQRASGDTQRDLMILLAAVAFVLAISCVNTANLQLSQSVVREREAAVRTALGATRLRLIRQSLTQSILLGLGGGACGVLLAWWAVRVMAQAVPPEITMVNVYAITIDRRVLLFATVISCLTGMLFGLIPAFRASRVDVTEKLSGTGRSYSGTMGLRRVRSSLVVGQVALSFALLVGAGLMIRSLRIIYSAPEGFQTANLVVLNLKLPQERYSTGTRQAALFAGIEERISATPGVAGATVATGAPPDVRLGEDGDLEIEGRAKAQADMDMHIPGTEIEPDYFRVLGVRLIQGRTFAAVDGATDSGAVIINQTMARRYWPASSAIGERFRFWLRGSPQEWHTVVGVVGDVKEFDWQDKPSQLELYEPMPTGKATDSTWVSLIARTSGDTAGEIKAIKEAIWSQDSEIPIDRIATYRDLESGALSLPQFYAKLMAVFAAIALLLSTIGIYGVISYSTMLRTREIGIRMALGAQANHAVRMVVREGLVSAGFGVLLGIACAAMVARIIGGFLYGVTAADPVTFIAVSAIFLSVAVVASLLPARRASRVDPMVALRSE
jgi:predicted permease